MKVFTIFVTFILFQIIFSCAPMEMKTEKKSGQVISKGEVFKNLTQITFNEAKDHSPSISNNGRKLLFVSDRSGNYDIYLKDNIMSRASIKKTSHQGEDINPCFSPDDSKFCFASNRNGNFDVFIMNVERGFAKTQITVSDNDEILPSWSPKGNVIAFTQYSNYDEDWYIWTKNIQTGQLTQICRGYNPVFSPDGKSIYYLKFGEKYSELWRVELDGENDTQLIAADKWGVGNFTLSPNGSRAIYSTIKGFEDKKEMSAQIIDGMDLWVLDISSGNLAQFTTHKGSDFNPNWSKTGQIYFTSDRLGKINIWMINLRE